MENINNYCTISNNVINGCGQLKWCIRENPKKEVDSGWVFLSSIDTSEFLSETDNWSIVPISFVVEVEPAILQILEMSYGTEVTLVREDNGLFFVDSNTGEKL